MCKHGHRGQISRKFHTVMHPILSWGLQIPTMLVLEMEVVVPVHPLVAQTSSMVVAGCHVLGVYDAYVLAGFVLHDLVGFHAK